ncbi:MAG: VWA domain-containing protein [Thermoleophilia bacterium]
MLAPAQAGAFGTVNGFFGQNGEHERITRAALACDAGVPSDGTCFEPVSVTQIAGQPGGTFGAVGIPDFPPPSGPDSHCDDGDYLDPAVYPKVKRYPQTRAEADAALIRCRTQLQKHFRTALAAAPPLLDPNDRIVPAHVDLSSSSCTFLGGISGRAKCDVFDGLGRALHGVQDFYSHSNWSDGPVPAAAVTARNPPGLNRSTVAPLMDFRLIGPPAIPDGLITGCFSVHEKNLSPVDGCRSGLLRTPRVRHKELNKDEGDIDPVTGAATAPTTARGKAGTNFASAVALAIADTRRQWSDLRTEIVRVNGPARGNLIVCALTRDDPLKDCQGRKLAIVVDSSGSNQTTDPSNLRIRAAAAFNAALVSAAEAGPDGRADRSAVIDFDDGARVVTPLGDPDAASFAGIDSSGGTNIGSGVTLAIDELTRDPADPTVNRAGIVVLTDGEDSDRSALIAAINRAASLRIRVSLGFLAPPANPVQNARASHQTRPAPPADLVGAIVASGGVFSTIDTAAAQEAFVTLVGTRGATNLDDPDGPDDGGPLASGVGATGVASPPADTDTFSFPATRGRILSLEVRTLTGQPLTVRQRDVGRGTVMARTRTRADGTAGILTRLRRSRLVEIDVAGAGGPYSVAVTESGVDRRGTRGADRITCPAEPTYVEGRGGRDTVVCGAGDDMIAGGPGADVVDAGAGAGDDIVLVGALDRHAGTELITGGRGSDVVEFETGRTRAVRIPAGRTVIVTSGRARFRLQGVETVLFGHRR